MLLNSQTTLIKKNFNFNNTINFFYNKNINNNLHVANKLNENLFENTNQYDYNNNIVYTLYQLNLQKISLLLNLNRNYKNTLRISNTHNFKINFFNLTFLNKIDLYKTILSTSTYNYSILTTFFLKNQVRSFFKEKIQKKTHIFYKNVILVDIFSKKLENNEISYNHEFFSNKSLNHKINYLFNTNFNKKNSKIIKICFKKKTKQCKKIFFKKADILVHYVLSNIIIQKKIQIKTYIFISKQIESTHNVNFLEKSFIYNIIKNLNNNNKSIYVNNTNSIFFNEYSNFKKNKIQNSYNYMPTKMNYNNYLPYIGMHIKSDFFKNVLIRNSLSPKFVTYYIYYLQNFLEILTNKKVWIKINTNTLSLINNNSLDFIQKLFKKNRQDQLSVGRHFYLLEFLEILFIAFFYRDLKFFSYWVKKTMEKLHLKKHRKFLKVIHNTLRNNEEFLVLLNVKGFTMDVRGKLGTTGNSKKKHYAFTVGSMSPTTKNHDMALNQTTVRTSTGVLGVIMTLSF